MLNSNTNSKNKLKSTIPASTKKQLRNERNMFGKEEEERAWVEYSRKHLIDVLTILTRIQKLFWEKVSYSSFPWNEITSILVWIRYKCKKKECLIIIQVHHRCQEPFSLTIVVKNVCGCFIKFYFTTSET